METPKDESGARNTFFDQAEYDALLRKHYFDPVVQHNVQLPGGRVLRRTTTSPPRHRAGRPRLRRAADGAEKKLAKAKTDVGASHLPRRPRARETRPPCSGRRGVAGGGRRGRRDEVIDLSAEENAIDVDAFVCDALPTKVVAVKTDPDGGTVKVTRAAPLPFPPPPVKPDPETRDVDDAPRDHPALKSALERAEDAGELAQHTCSFGGQKDDAD